jgi:hypothetical protein
MAVSSYRNAVNFSSARVAKRFPLLGTALESFLIGGWQMIWPQSTGKAQMKTILMLISLLITSLSEGQVKRMRQKFAKF